jgi:hypothetical protein
MHQDALTKLPGRPQFHQDLVHCLECAPLEGIVRRPDCPEPATTARHQFRARLPYSLSDSARSTAPLFIGTDRSRSRSSRALVKWNYHFPQTRLDLVIQPMPLATHVLP